MNLYNLISIIVVTLSSPLAMATTETYDLPHSSYEIRHLIGSVEIYLKQMPVGGSELLKKELARIEGDLKIFDSRGQEVPLEKAPRQFAQDATQFVIKYKPPGSNVVVIVPVGPSTGEIRDAVVKGMAAKGNTVLGIEVLK